VLSWRGGLVAPPAPARPGAGRPHSRAHHASGLRSRLGRRRRTVDLVAARRRSMVLQAAGLLLLVVVTADLVYKATHVV